MDRTLLVLGDENDYDSYDKFRDQLIQHRPTKLDIAIASYEDLESNRLPVIKTDSIIIYLFFPFEYWDRNIEHDSYRGVYGNVEFYNKFRALWSGINRKLNDVYSGRKLHFINHPLRISADRDKELTKTILANSGIDVPAQIFTRSCRDLLKLVNEEGKKLFLKVRYGSMGKGITYLEEGKWRTNFRFKRNRIVSMRSDHDWTFVDITDNTNFLKELLTKDIIIEEALDSPMVDGLKFDLRFYTCFDEVLYIYPRTNTSEAITTNISQGGRGRSSRFLEKIPRQIIRKAEHAAIKVTKLMGLEFAGVDIMISKDRKRASVIELNACPGFPMKRRFNLSKRIINSIEKHDFKEF